MRGTASSECESPGILEFERLVERAKQPRSLVKFFAESPLARVGIDLERTTDYGRTVDL